MFAQQAHKNLQNVTPLGELAALLQPDMQMVNKTILERMHSDIELIPKLSGYLIAAGGKRIRPLLVLASTRLFCKNTNRPYSLAAAVEFIHTATLLHDDVVDKSDTRRGKNSANYVFGNQASILVGDFLFSRAFQLMVEDGSLEILRILSDASATIAQGEVKQLSFVGNLELSLDEYLEIISSKTAALFAAACEIGPVITNEDTSIQNAMRSYGYNLGMAFQITDDVLDYSAKPESLGKAPGDDFREGKLTAPVLMALPYANQDETDFWYRTFVKKEQRHDDFSMALSILNKHKAFDASFKLANEYVDLAKEALLILKPSDIKMKMHELVSVTVNREF